MPEQDYSKILTPDTLPKPRLNYADFLDDPAEQESEPITQIPLSVGSPQFEEMLKLTRSRLQESGYANEIIDSLTDPYANTIPNGLDLGKLYDTMKPVFDENRQAIEETWKIAQQLQDDDVELSPFDWTQMRRMVKFYGQENVEGMAEARSFWQRQFRAIGDKAADTISSGVMNFTLGLALLDNVTRFNKRTKLLFVPQADKDEIEARVLPKITLGKDQEFSSGTAAGMWVMRQRIWGFLERRAADVPGLLGKMSRKFGNESLAEFFGDISQLSQERGEERSAEATRQIPPLISGLGDPLGWQEVIERNWDQVVDIDSI